MTQFTYNDITFIIPIKIDFEERIRNIILSVNYLSKIYPFKIIIKECDTEKKFEPYLNLLANPNITYLFEKNMNDFFHRTKLLNDMIELTNTDIVCNFDCDIILEQKNIDKSLKLFNFDADVVYPYGYGHNQKRIYCYKTFLKNKNNGSIPLPKDKNDIDEFILKFNSDGCVCQIWTSHYGHCVFFKTKSYKNGFLENELFRSYGPEDGERFIRFNKLGFKVYHLDNGDFINHLEHPRGDDSGTKNKYFHFNQLLYNQLSKLSRDDLYNEYKKFNYVKERNLC